MWNIAPRYSVLVRNVVYDFVSFIDQKLNLQSVNKEENEHISGCIIGKSYLYSRLFL